MASKTQQDKTTILNISMDNTEIAQTNLSWMQAKIGREKQFETALKTLRGKDTDISAEAAEIKVPYSWLCYSTYSSLHWLCVCIQKNIW